MSVFLDPGSGKWFDTLEELKAFQNGGAKGSPVSYKEKPKEVVEPKKEVKEDPVVEEAAEETEKEEIDYSDGITVNLTPDEMREELKNAGVDARSFAKKSDEDLAKFYYNFKNR